MATRHWLHASYGLEEYEESAEARIGEARALVLGGEERAGGVAEACVDGDVG